jgi:hypothetical protein
LCRELVVNNTELDNLEKVNKIHKYGLSILELIYDKVVSKIEQGNALKYTVFPKQLVMYLTANLSANLNTLISICKLSYK